MPREVDESESLEFPTIEPAADAKRKADFETDGGGVNQRKRVAAVTSCDAGDSPPDSEPSNDDAGILVAPDVYTLDDGLLHMFNEAASAFAGSPPAEASLVEAPTMPNQTKTGSQDITAEAASQKSGSDGTGHKSDKGRNLFPTWRVLPGREWVIEAWMTRIERKFKRKVNQAQAVWLSPVGFSPVPDNDLVVLQPISDGGCHFTCTARINGDIFYFDSSYGEQSRISDYMKKRLRELYGTGAKVICPSVQQQTVGSNLCGAFVLARLTAYAASPHQQPDKFLFRESEMRQHIFDCLEDESRRSLVFPRLRGKIPTDVLLSKRFSCTL
ncbi:hypothetical protein FOZ60_006743 [Perkinsus olseni]|uniref:Ubiquitin-like protease family profile domain-containing protein n=1 Tax=Perkinsus olseni TaxID=32597 RepID=A0A7J6NNI2_PEROL|nr:hypothetical protein FOZ60_006743 [Perkinsus olseni]